MGQKSPKAGLLFAWLANGLGASGVRTKKVTAMAKCYV